MNVITRSWFLLFWMHTLTFVKSQEPLPDCSLQDFLNGPLFDSNFNTTGLEASYLPGKQIRVSCNTGSSGFFQLLCIEGEWQSRGTKCQPQQCPAIHVSVGSVVRFSCNSNSEVLIGSQEIYCDEKGQWSGEAPTCKAISCLVPVIENGRVPGDVQEYKENDVLPFQCNPGFRFTEDRPSKCTKLGLRAEWSPTPACEQKCKFTGAPENMRVLGSGQVLTEGQKLTFSCRRSRDALRGKSEVKCLANGRWSDPFPTCGAPLDCEQPPPLANGDTKYSLKFSYRHTERVEYVCQAYHVMKGGPLITCKNGEWTGEIRCLKPCTVDEEAMRRRNIMFRFSRRNKIYSVHGDDIMFSCTRGRTVGSVLMGQTCVDGVLLLPSCQ